MNQIPLHSQCQTCGCKFRLAPHLAEDVFNGLAERPRNCFECDSERMYDETGGDDFRGDADSGL